MKLEDLVWPTVVLILGLFLVFTIREYLLDKNEIESEIGRANCILELKKIDETNFDYCNNIATYKLGEKGQY